MTIAMAPDIVEYGLPPEEEVALRPQPRQELFLRSSADITIYGGAAGGGKTFALLLEPLYHVANKAFSAITLRRTYPELIKQGGIWDEAHKVYFAATPNKSEMKFNFPSGASVSFDHMQHETDKYKYKSAQIPLIQFDQLETFTEGQFFYMLSRNRSTSGVKPYMRATCNPEPGWLAEWLDWWIAEDGYADLSRVGRWRWFARSGDDIVWADTRQELIEKLGPDAEPKSVTFIVSTVFDNEILMDKDPGYLASLKAMPLVDRERLLGDAKRGGNWKIKPAAGLIFKREWFPIVNALPAGGVEVLFWDFAATAKQIGKADPDFTAGVSIRKTAGAYTISYVTAEQLAPAGVDRTFANTSRQLAERAKLTGTQFMVRWEIEPGSAGLRESRRLTQMLDGLDARGVSSRGEKYSRMKPLAAQAEAGNVAVLSEPWTEMALAHFHNVDPDPRKKVHDDIADAGAGAYSVLVDHAPGQRKAQSLSTR